MEIALIIISTAILILLLVLVIKLSSSKTVDLMPQLIDLKNEITTLKTKQLESQTEYIEKQQKLLNDTQNIINKQLNAILSTVSENLTRTQENITKQLSSTSSVINEIQKNLGTLEVTTKNIQEIGKDISSLQDLLRAPKLRGNIGEYLLEELLKEIFPAKNYELKYTFKNGTQVDAIIKLGDGIVPVDSKFPLESFQRLVSAKTESEKKQHKKDFIKSVKDRIDEIASKYINPDEGTFDFAMIYIPAENVFYETIINDSLTDKEYEIFNYAIKKHVIPVSPNSFYAYLMALVYGLKGMKIEQQAKLILGELSTIQSAFSKFYSDFTIIGRHLSNAFSKYNESLKTADKFNDKLSQLTGAKHDLLEAPPSE
ncbi:MAG: DNA recombination protein RmuC [Ignavibacteria bacterium]|nr:DNA recombination protein RmuC [Ignavibacteria bacterium]